MSNSLLVTIPAGRVSADLENFTAQLSLSAATGLDTIFDMIGSDWTRLHVSVDGSPIPVSVEYWSVSNRLATLLLLLDIASAADTNVTLLFGDELEANPMIGATGSTPGVAALDAATLAWWSLCQDPSGAGACVLDAKGAYHGTPAGGMTAGNLVAHGIGMGLALDGLDDVVNLPALPALTSWTMAVVVTPTTVESGDGIAVIDGNGIVFASGYVAGLRNSDVIRRGSAVAVGAPLHVVVTWNGSSMLVYEAGVEVGVALSNAGWGLSGAYRLGSGYLSRKPAMTFSGVSVANVARSAAWVAAMSLSASGSLFDEATPVSFLVVAGLEGIYSLCMEGALVGRYGDAAVITAGLIGRYGNAATVQAALVGRYGDMVPVLAALEGRYHLMHAVLAGLEGEYAICGSSVLAALDGRYDLRERNEIMAALVGYYSLLPGAAIQQIVCPVRIGGVSVRWASVSWTLSEDSYLIEATVVLRDPAEFGSIAKMDTVEIDWSGTTYTLFVAAKLRSRSISGDAGAAEYGADYTIIARSLTAGLDAPYALPVTMSWPATTLASAIAADLIASLPELITLDFRLEDWLQPGGTFFLTDESPLEGLRKLAAIIGGIVQTSPNNALILRMADPTPPAEWATVVPAWTIEDSGLFSDSESEAESNRYNVITVSNQGESDRSTRFEVEDITEYRKRVRGYRVPWADFGLATSGGAWVTIEDGGVVEEPVVDEVVEFVEGSSSAPLPVYSMVSVVWLQASLGAITAAEDGSLTSEVMGNSLAQISYTTRCHMWIGTSPRSEEVQFYEVER